MKKYKMSLESMKEALVEYYESAGFKDIWEKTLKHKTDEEIVVMYEKMIAECEEVMEEDEEIIF